ncbi:MAG: glycosyltransferase [Chitinophagales bacterium]|nr:glycosyltransferase [Chitinophagales bacterium]
MIVFIIIICLLLYTYIIYAIFISLFKFDEHINHYNLNDDLPTVNIIIPIHNEEKVIAQKLESIINNNYPKNKINIYIGLDNCTDASQQIVATYQDKLNIQYTVYTERQGKPSIINNLMQEIPKDDLVILTDADIIFDDNLIYECIKYFKTDTVGLVDAMVINQQESLEKEYLNFETKIKLQESKHLGLILASFGACYAIRAKYFKPIPKNLVLDDMWIGMNINLQNKRTILNENAKCFEIRDNRIQEEFNRKVRISSGGFQIIPYFKNLLLQPFNKLSFALLSHKVLRWCTPFLLLYAFIYLMIKLPILILVLTVTLLILTLLFIKFDFDVKYVKHFIYFMIMQVAVLLGFFKAIKGIQSNVWKPTTR